MHVQSTHNLIKLFSIRYSCWNYFAVVIIACSPTCGRPLLGQSMNRDRLQSGIRSGDVIVRIGELDIREHSDLAIVVHERTIGEKLPTTIIREGAVVDVLLELSGTHGNLFNARSDGYPIVFEHDIPLTWKVENWE